jgi:hypothetical protein
MVHFYPIESKCHGLETFYCHHHSQPGKEIARRGFQEQNGQGLAAVSIPHISAHQK